MTSAKIILNKGVAILTEPSIIENQIAEGTTIEVEDVLAFKQANIQLSGGKPYAVLLEFAEMTTVSSESRELVASKGFKGDAIAEAIIINSLGQRIIADFYLKVNKPHIPTRIFDGRERAMDWLRTQVLLNFQRVKDSEPNEF